MVSDEKLFAAARAREVRRAWGSWKWWAVSLLILAVLGVLLAFVRLWTDHEQRKRADERYAPSTAPDPQRVITPGR